jgi:WD40 repeat protein
LNKECPKREKKRDIRKEKELIEYNWIYNNKIKTIPIKHDNSNDKCINTSDGKKRKLLKSDIINKDRIIMIFNNNIIIENKINNNSVDIVNNIKIKSFKNKINEKFTEKINNKIIKFCNFGKVVIIGCFYDGGIQIIYLEDKIEKKRKELYPFDEEEPILSISLNNDETFMILGNSIGSIAIYNIDVENNKWYLHKIRLHQMSPISDININNDLNIFASCSIDGYINLYTLPLCKLVRSIKIPLVLENNEKCNFIFLSESSLPSIIIITEDNGKCDILSYSINGRFLASIKEDKTFECPIKIKDLNSFEYLAYYANSKINIINLPSLTLQFSIEVKNNFKNLCINDDLNAIYIINEDGTQINVIRC